MDSFTYRDMHRVSCDVVWSNHFRWISRLWSYQDAWNQSSWSVDAVLWLVFIQLSKNQFSDFVHLLDFSVMEKMGHIKGLPGLFVICIFSGALRCDHFYVHLTCNSSKFQLLFLTHTFSTLSSGYNALATVTWDDFLKRYFRTSSEATTGQITKVICKFWTF